MSPVEFKKRPCRPVEFKGQWPQKHAVNHFLPVQSESVGLLLIIYEQYLMGDDQNVKSAAV